ncbi:MAG: hypothetical protein K2J64_04605, partial [Desulfovibrio sp.]|nr:hypothetical protein [Desulfovibrio sp.]
RRYTFLNQFTELRLTYGGTKDGSGMAALIIIFQPRKDFSNTDINKAIDNYYNILPIKKDSLPFFLQWGDSSSKVKSVLQKECVGFLAESDTKLKNVLFYTAAIKSNVPAIVICTIIDNKLYKVSLTVVISNNNNNKDISNGIAQKLRDNLVAYENAKIISSSINDDQERSTLILPYAVIDIVSVKSSTITKNITGKDEWGIDITFAPIPEDIAPSTKKHSIDEIMDTLNELKK